MNTIGAAKFKAQCLRILDDLDDEGLVITKHGKPVAMLLPHPQPLACLIGSLRGKITIHGDIMSTGAGWDVETQP